MKLAQIGIIAGTGGVIVNPLIQTWYNSLSVKPSAGLLTDLNTLVQSISGIWSNMDFFSLIAGMETDEQRLRPLITTSGNDITKVGTFTTFNNTGAQGNGTTGYLNFNWIPSVNGVKFTLNSSSGVAFINGTYSGSSSFMGCENASSGRFRVSIASGSINVAIQNQTIRVVAGGTASYSGVTRSASGALRGYRTIAGFSSFTDASNSLCTKSVFGCAHNANGTPSGFSSSKFKYFAMGKDLFAGPNWGNPFHNNLVIFFNSRGV